jgi:hypothetical protein
MIGGYVESTGAWQAPQAATMPADSRRENPSSRLVGTRPPWQFQETRKNSCQNWYSAHSVHRELARSLRRRSYGGFD